MPYYILKPATNTIETGPVFPQVQKMSPNYDFDAINSVYALSKKAQDFPDFNPNLDYFIVHNKAKLTDILSNSILPTTGFLITEKFKTLLADFKLMSHQFYNAKLYYKKEFHQYNWLHFKTDLINTIDFKNSSFIILLNYAHNLGHVEISSMQDYNLKKEKIKADNVGKTVSLWAEKITLSPSFDKQLDFFKIGTFDSNYYISEKLKTAIYSQKITGCNISFANNLIN